MEALKTWNLAGIYNVTTDDGKVYDMKIPGTLDESNIGRRDPGIPFAYDPEYSEPEPESVMLSDWLDEEVEQDRFADTIKTRYTRRYYYEGPARISRMFSYREVPGTRLFLEVERARVLSLYVDGMEVEPYQAPSLSTPQIFEVTGLLNGDHMVTFVSDNTYPGLPRKDIRFSSTASDESQTNWNGLLGYVRLREEEETFVDRIVVRPSGNRLTVYLEISALQETRAILKVSSPALKNSYEKTLHLTKEYSALVFPDLELKDDIEKWDEGEGKLYDLTVSLNGVEKSVSFGVRDLGSNEAGRFTLNGRPVFLRGETNCVVYPETGHAPMDISSWRNILKKYQEYGVNFVRFHSNCPPEAAFAAADELGMLILAELSCWNPVNAMEEEEAQDYYLQELREILLTYGSHPSFVFLSFGNEPDYGEEGAAFMERLILTAKKIDPTRLYTMGSNAAPQQEYPDTENDFYMSANFREYMLRATSSADAEGSGLNGFLNSEYPNSRENYNEAIRALRRIYKGPVIGFEAGQYATYPDFKEKDLFSGFLAPGNIEYREHLVSEAGLEPVWSRYIRANGELALLCYRAEVEAVLRTEGMSGLALLGLQDFPGQGASLVGMMNTHLLPKKFPFAEPERFRAFFRPVLPLVLLESYTYEYGDILVAKVQVANYGKETLAGPVTYTLKGEDVLLTGKLNEREYPAGKLSPAGEIICRLSAENMHENRAYKLTLTVTLGKESNQYPIWVYPKFIPICPEQVYETGSLDQTAIRVLNDGGTVFLTPRAEAETLPGSVKSEFTPDFWNHQLFPFQSGTMGQLIEENHPVFRYFPTEDHTDYQWFPMASSRAAVLKTPLRSIVTVMDSCDELRMMSQLFEFRCLNGNVLFSTMGLKERMEYPEVRALLSGIYEYLGSYDFSPSESMRLEDLRRMVISTLN